MKILVIHDDCTSPGGSNNYRKQLSEMLRQKGIETSLFTFAIDNTDEDEKPYYCYRYPGGKRIFRHIEFFYYNRSLIEQLRRWIRLMKPDLIHIHNNYCFTASVLLACQGKATVIQTVHDFRILCWIENVLAAKGQACQRCLDTICSRTKLTPTAKEIVYAVSVRLYKIFLKYLLKRTINYFIVPSKALENAMKGHGLRTAYLPHFIDCRRYPITAVPKDRNDILFVGFLHFSKGVHILLRAFSRVVTAIPSAHLHIAGNGPYENTLKELSVFLKLNDRVTFYGDVPHQEMHEFYKKAGVVVLPSVVIENSPLTIYEAMASCRPVVASRIGGIPDLVRDGENGHLVDCDDEVELSKRIIDLLVDKNKAEKMGLAGRRLAESLFSPEFNVNQYLGLVRSLTA